MLPLFLAAAALADPILTARPLATLPGSTPTVTSIAALPTDPDVLWITSRDGRLFRLNLSTRALAGPLAVFPTYTVGNETGLLGLAFHPDFQSNGLFYVYRSLTTTPRRNVVSEFRTDPARPDQVDLASERLIIRLGEPRIHNGGWLGFGPDRLLYIAVGENGVSSNAQDTTDNLLGKILRIDPDRDDFPADPDRNYAIPPGNPFIAAPGDDELWLFGLRNPWRCAFDAPTGDLWIGDVGNATSGEIDRIPPGLAGLNLGWPCYDGPLLLSSSGACANPGPLTAPVAFINRELDGTAITGGALYRGASLPRARGLYLFSDYGSPRLFSVTPGLPGYQPIGRLDHGLVCFGADLSGELYAGASGSGVIYAVECGSDFNHDGFTDFFDYADFVAAFIAARPDGPADVNADSFVDFFDYADFVEAFEQGC